MKFPQEFIERVRESTNIVDIIGQHVQLRRTGGNYQGLCPFHHEKSPSFSVSQDKQVYHCFGCKASGNVYTFLQNYQGLSFPESVELLARRAGMAIPEAKGESSSRDLRQTFYKINQLAAQFYVESLRKLPKEHLARKYLQTRGLIEPMITEQCIGYAPDAWSDLAQFLESKRVPMALAEQLGLVKRRTGAGSSGHYDLFRNRIVFPIFSPAGQCIGFGGRVLSKEQSPKYLNSVDSPVFHKGKVFYGLNHSAKFIRAEDEIIVVEGYMDWLALVGANIHNVGATLGTALTAEHAKLIKRYTNKVLVLFDGDAAGKQAAARSLPILLSEGLHVRGLFLPDQLDPDEFLAERGVTALRELIANAPDLFDLVSTEAWLHAKGKATSKVQLLDEFSPILAGVADPRLRALYAQNFANMIDVDLKLVGQSVRAALQNRTRVTEKPHDAGSGSSEPQDFGVDEADTDVVPVLAQFELNGISRAEAEILNLILLKEVYLKEALAAEVDEQFSNKGARGLFTRIAEVYRQMPSKFDTLSALLAAEVKPSEIITRHLSEEYQNLSEEAASKLLQDCIKRVKETYLRLKSKELVSSLRGTGPVNASEQLEQIMNIHKSRRALNRES